MDEYLAEVALESLVLLVGLDLEIVDTIFDRSESCLVNVSVVTVGTKGVGKSKITEFVDSLRTICSIVEIAFLRIGFRKALAV